MWRRVIQALALLLVLAAAPCLALDAHKTAAALASRAAKAYEAGNMTEAATLYRDAFHIDAKESAYLYGAARAAHTGHDLAGAERDYTAFLELPGADPARVQKAKGFLENVHAELSLQKVAEAKKAEDVGDALLAATLYLEAWRMAPEQPEPLLKAALLERRLGDKKAAVENLRRYLQLASADATGRGTAEALLQELGGKPAVAPPVVEKPVAVAKPARQVVEPVKKPVSVSVEPVPRKTVVAQPASAAPSRTIAGWTTIGLGGAAVLAAGIFAILANSQQATLDGNLLPDGNFDGRKVSVANAASEQTSINGKWTTVAVAAGVGVAAIGVGAWLVASAHADVAIVPGWDGFSIAGRF